MVRLLALLAVGLGAAWGYCRFTTPRYEARCECEVSFGGAADVGFEENLNTRLAVWKSELGDELAGVEVAPVPRSHLIAVTARDVRAEDVAARANAAAEALVSYTMNANTSRVAVTMEQLHAEVDRLRAADERLDKNLLEINTANVSEGGASARRLLEEKREKAIADIQDQEKRVRVAGEWADFLEKARTHPESPGAFPASVPESSEVRRVYKAWSAARGRLNTLRTKYTEAHQEVDAAKIALDIAEKEFTNVLASASTVADGQLASAMDQLKDFRRTAGYLRAELDWMAIRAAETNERKERFEQEKKATRGLYEEALRKENEMRMNTGQDFDQVRVVRAASVPKKPLYPDSVLAYSIGAGAPLSLWILLGFLWPAAPRRHTHLHPHHHSHDHSHDHSHHHTHDHSHDHAHDHTHHHSHDHTYDHAHHHSYDHTHDHSHHHSHDHTYDHTHHHSHDHTHDHSHHHSHDHTHEHSHHRHRSFL